MDTTQDHVPQLVVILRAIKALSDADFFTERWNSCNQRERGEAKVVAEVMAATSLRRVVELLHLSNNSREQRIRDLLLLREVRILRLRLFHEEQESQHLQAEGSSGPSQESVSWSCSQCCMWWQQFWQVAYTSHQAQAELRQGNEEGSEMMMRE